MSHKWDCPTRWEAERKGERDAEFGASRYSNPYDRSHGNHCPEAERAWENGHRAQERRMEEDREEARVAQQRQHERQRQEYEWQMEQEREAEERAMEEEYYRQMEAEQAAAPSHLVTDPS